MNRLESFLILLGDILDNAWRECWNHNYWPLACIIVFLIAFGVWIKIMVDFLS